MDEKKDQQNTMLVKGLVIGLGLMLIVMFAFSVGVFIGGQKARFSYRWGENYHRSFGGPRLGIGRPRNFFGGHGTAGEVIKKDKKSLMIQGKDNAEKVILIDKKTYLVKGRQRVELKDVRIGSHIVVVGSPDDRGRIKGRLIRVFDAVQLEESMWRRNAPKPSSSLYL